MNKGIFAVSSETHTKHINAFCEQDVLKIAADKVITAF
jgi:hypothetical protein